MWFHLTHENEISFTPIIKVFLPRQIFTKLVSAKHHCVQTANTEFRTNWTVSADNADRQLFTSLSKVWLSHWDDFHESGNDIGNFYKSILYKILSKSGEN
jgi:hypothetical protein